MATPFGCARECAASSLRRGHVTEPGLRVAAILEGWILFPPPAAPLIHLARSTSWSRDSTRLYVIRAVDGRREFGELTWRTGTFRRSAVIPPDSSSRIQ